MSCKHPSLFQNMCVVCGMRVQQSAPSNSSTAQAGAPNNYKLAMNVSGGKVLQLSAEEAASVTASKVNNLKNSKKLALVLDLDHTLLHAVQIEGQTPSRTAATARVIEGTRGIGSGDGSEDNLVHHLPIEEIDRFVVKHLVMKKRPFLDEFLEKASEFCQMTVYTAGTRRYAEAVAKVLDPSRKYFADRIVARCDVANVRADGNDKSLERIYPGDASMAVIIDDREDVWRGAQSQQLLMVKPFVHFDPRPSEASAAASQKIGDNASTPLPDALGTLSRGVAASPANGNGAGNNAVLSPVITLCASTAGEPAGRIAKVAPLYSFEHSCLDDQLKRCLQVLLEIHAQYYSTLTPNNSTEDSSAASSGSNTSTSTSASAETKSETSVSAVSVITDTNSTVLSTQNSSTTTSTTSTTATLVKDTSSLVPPSVGNILRNIKKKVLAGCTLTFSGLIPTNEENPRNHTLWRLAEALGAQVSTELLPRTTHLISIHTQTLKVSAVLAKRASEVWVLHPDWLIYCRWSLSRACEATFMLNQLAPGQAQPNPPMDYSPLPPAALPPPLVVAPLPPLPPPLSAPLIGAESMENTPRDANSATNESNRNPKRGRDDEGDRSSGISNSGSGSAVGGNAGSGSRHAAQSVVEDNSMMSALKRLKAVGPSSSTTNNNNNSSSASRLGSNANVSTTAGRKSGTTFPPIPAPITNGSSSSGSSSSHSNSSGSNSNTSNSSGLAKGIGSGRGPSPVTTISSRSQLFAHSTASAKTTIPSSNTNTAARVSTGTGAVGVIKKKATNVFLEDSPRGKGEHTKCMPTTANNHTNTTTDTTSTSDRYLVPLDAGSGIDYDYFSTSAIEQASSEMHEQEHIFNDNDVLSEGHSDEGDEDDEGDNEVEEGELKEVHRPAVSKPASNSSKSSRSSSSSSRDSIYNTTVAKKDSDGASSNSSNSSDEHSLSGHHRKGLKMRVRPSYKEDDEEGGESGNEYYLGSADEAEEEEEEWDKGMLCCNDDQGSTCSATGSSYLLLDDEDELIDNSNDHDTDDRDADSAYRYGDVASNRGSTNTNTNSSGGVGARTTARRSDSNSSISNSNHSGSSDDEGSDFEVMMNRRRMDLQTDSRNANAGFLHYTDGTIVESEEDFEYP